MAVLRIKNNHSPLPQQTWEFVTDSKPLNQNRMKFSNLVGMGERFQESDRAAAAVANSVMQVWVL